MSIVGMFALEPCRFHRRKKTIYSRKNEEKPARIKKRHLAGIGPTPRQPFGIQVQHLNRSAITARTNVEIFYI